MRNLSEEEKQVVETVKSMNIVFMPDDMCFTLNGKVVEHDLLYQLWAKGYIKYSGIKNGLVQYSYDEEWKIAQS